MIGMSQCVRCQWITAANSKVGSESLNHSCTTISSNSVTLGTIIVLLTDRFVVTTRQWTGLQYICSMSRVMVRVTVSLICLLHPTEKCIQAALGYLQTTGSRGRPSCCSALRQSWIPCIPLGVDGAWIGGNSGVSQWLNISQCNTQLIHIRFDFVCTEPQEKASVRSPAIEHSRRSCQRMLAPGTETYHSSSSAEMRLEYKSQPMSPSAESTSVGRRSRTQNSMSPWQDADVAGRLKWATRQQSVICAEKPRRVLVSTASIHTSLFARWETFSPNWTPDRTSLKSTACSQHSLYHSEQNSPTRPPSQLL